MHKILFYNKFIICLCMFRALCAHHQEFKIVLCSIWYHHTCRWPSRAQVERGLSQPVHETATYWYGDTRGCVMQFWPSDDEHMCSEHVEAWNKLTVKQKFCASSWLITEIKNVIGCLQFGLLCLIIWYLFLPWPFPVGMEYLYSR